MSLHLSSYFRPHPDNFSVIIEELTIGVSGISFHTRIFAVEIGDMELILADLLERVQFHLAGFFQAQKRLDHTVIRLIGTLCKRSDSIEFLEIPITLRSMEMASFLS